MLAPLAGGLATAAAIAGFTMAMRLLLLPLSYRAMRGMAAQARIAPLAQALRKQHAGQPDRLQRELTALYRSEGTSMFGGCLPALAQWPVLSVLYLLFRSPRRSPVRRTHCSATACSARRWAATGWAGRGRSARRARCSLACSCCWPVSAGCRPGWHAASAHRAPGQARRALDCAARALGRRGRAPGRHARRSARPARRRAGQPGHWPEHQIRPWRQGCTRPRYRPK